MTGYMKFLLLLASMQCLSCACPGHGSGTDTIQVRHLELTDRNGSSIGRLGSTEEGLIFFTLGSDPKKATFAVTLHNNSSSLFLGSAVSGNDVSIAANNHNTMISLGIGTHARLLLMSTSDGSEFAVRGADDIVRAKVVVTRGANPAVTLYDAEGKVLWRAP